MFVLALDRMCRIYGFFPARLIPKSCTTVVIGVVNIIFWAD